MRGIHERAAAQPTHPGALDWATVDLPNTWPDTYRLRRLMRLARSPLSRPRRVELPPGLPGAGTLPRYLLREFHNLPNGYYSHRVSTGYARLFDVIMLGTLRRARRQMAQRLAHLHSVLDVGCGAGQLAGELERSGVPHVWGLDPCPYLLRLAARKFPRVRFVQGLAEDTQFPDARFDGLGVCFVLHELPPAAADRSLAEFHRVLRRDGLLAVTEPAPEHYGKSRAVTLLRQSGVAAVYFHLLARRVYEPYVRAWHRRDLSAWLAGAGFTVLADEARVPFRHVLACRV